MGPHMFSGTCLAKKKRPNPPQARITGIGQDPACRSFHVPRNDFTTATLGLAISNSLKVSRAPRHLTSNNFEFFFGGGVALAPQVHCRRRTKRVCWSTCIVTKESPKPIVAAMAIRERVKFSKLSSITKITKI